MIIKVCKALCLFVSWGTISLITTGCKEGFKETSLYGFHDPYDASFWNRGVKFMLTDMSEGIVDTTAFDDKGNIIRVQVFQNDRLQREFDSAHNVIRQIEKGEFYKHFILSYDTIDRYIIKEMNLVSNDGSFDNDENAHVRKSFLVIYRQDESGRIVEEIDSELTNTITEYSYARDKLSSKKEFYLLGKARSDEEISKQWRFFYTDGVLHKIESYWGNELNSTQYFDEDGLLKYTVHKGKPGYPDDTLRHRYIYY